MPSSSAIDHRTGDGPARPPRRLRVEHTESPVGIDVVPRFSWLGTTPWRLRIDGPDVRLLDTGPRHEPPVDITVGPLPWRSLTRYRWTVEDERGRASASFITGVLDGDWHGARWIGFPHPSGAAPLLRVQADVSRDTTEAYLVVAGGGTARVHVNGALVEPSVLSPGFTDYEETVQYTVSDVTPLLSGGRLVIAAELGRGFFGMAARNTWDWHRAPWHDEPCVRVLLLTRGVDGVVRTVVSGAHWRATDGPTRSDDLHAGEDYDARLDPDGWTLPGFDDGDWGAAVVTDGPRGRLVHQRQQPIGVTEVFEPDRITPLGPGRWVASFPRVIAGWVEIDADPDPGEVVELRFGEALLPDGSPNAIDSHGYFDGRFQTDRCTLADRPVRWHPRFVYHGFQHVEVRARTLPRLRAALVHSLVPRTGRFEASDPLLGTIHELTVRTVLNNLHGVPTDTPMYEKNGWTGDGMLAARLMLQNLDCQELLAKWAADVAASRHGSGAPTVLAPDGGWHVDWSPAPTWHSALILVPWELWLQRGDRRVLEDLWEDASDYVRFELARSPGGIATTNLGDWVSPDTDAGGGNAPEDPRIAATAYLVAMLDVLAEWATVLGHPDEEWRLAAARSRAAFRAAFLRDGVVAGDGDDGFRQAHGVLALAFDLLPVADRQRVADAVAEDVARRDDHLWTGALATKHLLPQLTRFGHADLALRVATQTTFPSWGLWIELGATSLWEHWKPESRSRGHYFLGTIDDWLFADVAGLTPIAPGWRRARIAPRVPALGSAGASVDTPFGVLSADWRREGERIELTAVVPEGVTATVELPGLVEEVGAGTHLLIGHQAV